nr:MAG: hypothetical protein [Caudoviricetes sp.]
MNIFFLDYNVAKCAQMHNDKHCIKMILEYAQLLSTAHRVIDGKEVVGKSKTGRKQKRWELNDARDSILYSATHINHPSAIWSRQSSGNYRWLHNLLVELCKEYTYRYGKIHKCESSGLVSVLYKYPNNISVGNFTEPTPAMPDEIKIVNDSVASYRNYYNKSKQHLATWNGKINSRSIPEWFVYV